MGDKAPVVQEPAGPVARPAKPGGAAKADSGYVMSDVEALKLTVSMRGKLSRKEFSKLIAGLPRVARILSPFGLQGCYVDDEKNLAEFDAALAKWARATGHPEVTMGSLVPVDMGPRQTSIGPVDYAALQRCREDPEACMSPQQRWELYNQRVDRIRSDGIGAVMAGVGEATAAGLTAVGVPMEFDSNKFLENAAPATGALNAIGSAGVQRQATEDTVRAAQVPAKTPSAEYRSANPAPPAKAAPAPVTPVSRQPAAPAATPPIPAKAAPLPVGPVSPQPAATVTPPAATTTAPAATPARPPVPVSSPTNNPDFSSVGQSVGTEKPGTVTGAPKRNTYPDFTPVSQANQPKAQAQTARLSSQLNEPIPADRVLEAPWIGRMRNSRGEMMSSGTSEGWLRSESRFWSAFKRQFPADFALIGPNRTVTPQLAQKWGWSNQTIGQKLIHHHIDNGNLVVPVPEGLHQGSSGSIHATVKIEGRP